MDQETRLETTNLNKGALRRLQMLHIFTLEDLTKRGAASCYIEMKKRFEGKSLPKCYNLYDLHATIQGYPKVSQVKKKWLYAMK